MVRLLKDEAGNLVAVVNMDEVALVTRVIDKDQEYTAISFPIDFVASQLYLP